MIRAIASSVVQLLVRLRVEGDRGALARARQVVVANHESLLDPLLLALLLPRRAIVVITPEAARHPLVRFFSKAFDFVVLDSTRPLELKRLVRHVQRGAVVAIFPQGRVSTTGALMKVYDSAGVIAARSRANVLPVHFDGTVHSRFAAVRGAWPRRWWPRVTLTVQSAVEVRAPDDASGVRRRRVLSDEMLKLLQRSAVAARRRQTLYEAFVSAIELHGRDRAIVEDARQQPETYGELLKTALALARLASRVTCEGETVGVMLPNVTTTIALVFALTGSRRVAAMLNYTAGAEAMQVACVAADVKTVITSRRFVTLARLEPCVRALDRVRFVYIEDLRAGLTAADRLWIAQALARPRTALGPQDPSAAAIVLFTSGSEARAKGVAITHDAMLANIAQMRAVIDFGPNDRYLNALPLYHTYGLIACTLMPLVTGTPLFLYTTPLHYRVIPEFAYTRDCTYVFGTSTFLAHYGRYAHPYDFYRTRVVVCGGEKLSPEVARLWMNKFGLRIMEGYGATECGPTLALNTPLAYREGTVGRFLPCIDWRIVSVPGIVRGGALHVHSPHLMAGYYFHGEPGVLHPPRSEVGTGWYNTGDVVEVDEDGFVTILGRVKRFAKVAGEMVSLELVERIAYTASPEHKHAATVEQISGSGESTVLFTTDAKLDRMTLVRSARELGVQDLAVARRIVKVASLPLLGSGKTDYVTLTRMTVRTG